MKLNPIKLSCWSVFSEVIRSTDLELIEIYQVLFVFTILYKPSDRNNTEIPIESSQVNKSESLINSLWLQTRP